MSDAEVEVPSSFKKRNLKNRGGRKRKQSSSEEKNSSSSDEQTVVLPTKRPQKQNPNIQRTAGPKKVKPQIEDAGSDSSDEEKAKQRTTLSVQQQRENATATYEMDTEHDRDAQAIFEKAQKINEDLQGQADDKVYRGLNNYAQYYKKRDTAAGNASSGLVRKGPIRAPANLRATVRMECRSRTSPEQFAALLEFMESHDDISRPQPGPHGRMKADRLWLELTELLNSICVGVIRPVEKWKKVWADWKAKTKKKAWTLRCEASGTDGGASSRQPLTAAEEKVLGIMGLTAVVDQAGTEERDFDGPPSEGNSRSSPTRDSVNPVCPSQISAADEIIFDFIPYPIQATTSTVPPSLPPSGELQDPLPPLITIPPATASATSPTASTSRGTPQQRRRERARSSPTPAASHTSQQRRALLRARTRRIQTHYERATTDFVCVELRRLQLEADRERNTHEREMERLRLESRRIGMEEKQTLMLSRLAGTLDKLMEILPQLRPLSIPSTDKKCP